MTLFLFDFLEGEFFEMVGGGGRGLVVALAVPEAEKVARLGISLFHLKIYYTAIPQ